MSGFVETAKFDEEARSQLDQEMEYSQVDNGSLHRYTCEADLVSLRDGFCKRIRE
jgi:hypothetical protein